MKVKMKGPHNHGGLSHAGENYEPDEKGCIEVPNEAINAALEHGFTIVEDAPAEAGADESKPGADLTALTVKQLVALAKDDLGIDLDPSLKKKEMVAAIEAELAKKAEAGADESAAA